MDLLIEDGTESFQEERINAGIAIVVPSDKIRETLKPLGGSTENVLYFRD